MAMVKLQFEACQRAFRRIRPKNWLLLVLSTAVLVLLSWWLGSWGLRVVQDWTHLQQNPTDATQKQFNASLEIVKAIVGGLGTLATIVGGIVLYLNFRVANQNAKTAIKTWKLANRNAAIANKNAAIANKTVELTESRLITERFSKAVEQLGSDKIEVRLGGIYALERIAQDSKRDHWTIMEVLTAFLREKCSVKSKAKESFANHCLQQREAEAIPTPITKDVQAALTVIGRRNTKHDPEDKQLDLSHSNFSGANLYKANLASADFDSTLFKGTNFRYANLSNAFLGDANLSNADLTSANLNSTFLVNADLREATLVGSFLNNADLSSAILFRTVLFGADLSSADLMCAFLGGAILCNAILCDATLNDANLSHTNLLNAIIDDSQMNTALLCRTTLPDGTISDRDCEAIKPSPSNSSTSKAEPDSQ